MFHGVIHKTTLAQFFETRCRVIGLHFCRWVYGSIFIQICAVGSKRRTFSAPECVLAVQGRSGSSKVDDFGTNRKCVYDFLLVGHSDYGPILYRFWDTVTYWLKLPILLHFCYSSLIRRPHTLSLWNFAVKLSVRKLESWGYSVVKVAWFSLQPSLTDLPVWRTDRQTDRQMDGSIC